MSENVFVPQVAGQLGMYFITVLCGLFFHGFVVLPIIFSICTRQLPFRYSIINDTRRNNFGT